MTDARADRLRDLLSEQEGVVARRQVVAVGLDDSFIEGMLRRREWARVHKGVYVVHTGPPSWMQRAWAAVLFYWPAALCHESAVRVHGGGPPLRWRPRRATTCATVHVAVDHDRRVSQQPGVRVHRVRRLADVVAPARRPPRVRLEHALLDMASSAASLDEAVATLAHGCQTWTTSAERLAEALRARPRLPRRKLLLGILEDVAQGAYSALERRYLVDVERPHGLPRGDRQRAVRQGRSAAYRDVEYTRFGLVVELDGRLGHEEPLDRWDDLDRDILTAVSGQLTIRVGWGQVLDRCRLAGAVASLLHARGWSGTASPCSVTCEVVRGDSSADRARGSPRSG